MTEGRPNRNPNIDMLKGLLLLFVILGHLLVGPIRDNFGRYLIYGFHMPLFLSISGYLSSAEKLGKATLVSLIKTYGRRMLLPWLIAVQIYYPLTHIKSGFSLRSYLMSYIDIYFHLWYVIGLFSFFVLTMLLVRLCRRLTDHARNQDLLLIGLSLLISLIFCIYYHLPLEGIAAEVQYLIYHDFHFLYYLYFVAGIMIRKYHPRLPKGILAAGVFLFTLCYIYLYAHPNVCLEETVKCLLCLSLIQLCLQLADTQSLPENRFLEQLGRRSLAYYLYVQLAKTITVLAFPYSKAPVAYTICVIFGSLLVALLIHAAYRIKVIRTIGFGEKL